MSIMDESIKVCLKGKSDIISDILATFSAYLSVYEGTMFSVDIKSDGRYLFREEDNIMQRFKDILCVMAPDLKVKDALERAVGLAGNNNARLTVVEVVDEIPPNTKLLDRVLSPYDLQAKIVSEHRQRLEELITPWRNKNVEIQVKVLSGIPFLEIIKEVLRNKLDLVIKAADCSGALDRVFCSNDMHLLRKCPCPVWLVQSESPKDYQRILAAVDVDDSFSPEELKVRHLLNLQILEMASSLALSEFAELHIIHTWEAIGESVMYGGFITMSKDEITSYVEEVRQRHNKNLNVLIDEMNRKLEKTTLEHTKPQTHLLKGSPCNKIPALAEELNASLVVMGTVAHTGISGLFMGNTAETILNHIDCPILAIKPPGFETPVALEDQDIDNRNA